MEEQKLTDSVEEVKKTNPNPLLKVEKELQEEKPKSRRTTRSRKKKPESPPAQEHPSEKTPKSQPQSEEKNKGLTRGQIIAERLIQRARARGY